MRTNWDTVEDIEDRTSVPEGDYEVEVVEVQERETREGCERWALRLAVFGGDYAGRHAAWDGLVWSERAMPRAKRLLGALGLPVEGEQSLIPSDLVGRRGRVSLVHEDHESASGVVTRRMAVPYDGWSVAEPSDIDGSPATREARDRDSPF